MGKTAAVSFTPENSQTYGQGTGSFEEIWAEYYPRIYTFIRTGFGFPREDLEDLTQETLLRAYTRRENYDPSYAFSTWLYTIARNLSVDWLRKRKRKLKIHTVPLDEAVVTGGDETPERRLLAAEDRAAIKNALMSLDSRDRQVAFLWFYEDFTQARIAEILKTPIGTVKYRIHEIKKTLGRKLKGCV